eukprot:1154663-Pelagomonas_calceolata.AAC.5
MSITPTKVLQTVKSPTPTYLCPLDANKYGVEFLKFVVADNDSKAVVYEVWLEGCSFIMAGYAHQMCSLGGSSLLSTRKSTPPMKKNWQTDKCQSSSRAQSQGSALAASLSRGVGVGLHPCKHMMHPYTLHLFNLKRQVLS